MFSFGPLHRFFTRINSSDRRDDKISLQPFFASSYVNASPIPDEAPVTHTTLFLRSIIFLLLITFLCKRRSQNRTNDFHPSNAQCAILRASPLYRTPGR